MAETKEIFDIPTPDESIKALYRKVDLRLIPWPAISYFLLRTDSGSLTISAILNAEGKHSLRQHLSVTLTQWTWALSTFVYSYGFFEPISSFLTKKFTPSKWQGRIMLGWGIVTIATAAVKSYNGLIALRARFRISSQLLVLSEEIQTRVSLIYITFLLLSAFGGLLGYVIGYADGCANLYGWQWLLLVTVLEFVTVVVGAVCAL
ncbi:major facilitator superfamily domain-containing protein [Leptodontidium sp. MPI-SDFR-AT-0119]|nr:major facilitator superfamily domain-containing protein [Leptodontidium sp. MPI-SDFR-AT-0119]